MHNNLLVIGLIFVLGGLGSVVSAFLGDSAWHLPMLDTQAGVFRPGWIGNVLVGGLAAVASWGMSNPGTLLGTPSPTTLTLTTSAIANALVIGFGGASWFKGQAEKMILQKTAAIAATKAPADAATANKIATASPIEALKAAQGMAEK